RMWELHPDAMRVALAQHDRLLREAFEAQDGYIFKTAGDAFCVAFDTASAAFIGALEAQRALHTANWDGVGELKVRMALHTGAAEYREGDYFGQSLNRVSRILSSAHGGQVLLSLATQQLVRDYLPEGVQLRHLGEHQLRDLSRPEHLFQLVATDLPSSFPALRSLESVPNNLPVQLTSFVGREREMAEVKRLLASTRLLTLTGMGGTGKTRLSLQVAADLGERFEDGVWLVEFATVDDASLVVETVARALDLRQEADRPLQVTLTGFLRNKQLLLILDNCEHLITACARLAEALLRSCPQLRILASSREPLGIAGETAWPLPPLSLPDHWRELTGGPDAIERLTQYEAVRLFIERATIARPAFQVSNDNVHLVAQICWRLDGIALAIELAAARIRVLTLQQIVERLDDRFHLLTTGSRTAVPRQQTLRALIDWSYDLLTEP
ncbi:MAG: adenylate/guanylate cyclase domain-containing protein, partial [Verrucomicrobiaceae bacterium]